jgi:hypothetical protein
MGNYQHLVNSAIPIHQMNRKQGDDIISVPKWLQGTAYTSVGLLYKTQSADTENDRML